MRSFLLSYTKKNYVTTLSKKTNWNEIITKNCRHFLELNDKKKQNKYIQIEYR